MMVMTPNLGDWKQVRVLSDRRLVRSLLARDRREERVHRHRFGRSVLDAVKAIRQAAMNMSEERMVRCYLCHEQRAEDNTEVRLHVVPSGARGGTIQGVKRYVRMCRVGYGCKEGRGSGNDGTA